MITKKFTGILILLQMILLSAACQVRDSASISNEEFKRISKDTGVVILDVRTVEEYSNGHIPFAKNIDVLQSSSFKKQIEALPKNKTYLVYCRSGKRSATALHIMKENGFVYVKHLEHGFSGWNGEIAK